MKSKKILVIDDDADMRNLLGIRLKKYGYEVAFAADAPFSMTAARRHQPDLILLDIGLPGGDGYKVLERLSKNAELEDIPVLVFITVDGNAENRATPFSQPLAPGSNITLIAPTTTTLGGQTLSFSEWQQNGISFSTHSPVLLTLSDQNVSMTAVYRSDTRVTDTQRIQALNWSFGSVQGGQFLLDVREMPGELSAAISSLGVQSALLVSSDLPSGVSFSLDIVQQSGQLLGTFPNAGAAHQIVFDLFFSLSFIQHPV